VSTYESVEPVEPALPAPSSGRKHSFGDVDRSAFADAKSGRGSFGSAPELAPKVAPTSEVDPVVASIAADALAIAERAERAEEKLMEVGDAYTDQLYENAVNGVASGLSRDEAAGYAQELALTAGLDDYRTQSFIEDWGGLDPHGASAFVDAHLVNLRAAQAEAIAAEQNAEAQAAQQRAAAEVTQAWARFERNHARELAEQPALKEAMDLVTAAALSQDPSIVSPDRIDKALGDIYQRAREVAAAHKRTVNEWEARQAFRERTFGGIHGDLEDQALAPPTIHDVVDRLRPQADARAVQRKENLGEFRRSFAEAAAGSGFDDGAHERAAAAQRASETHASRGRGL